MARKSKYAGTTSTCSSENTYVVAIFKAGLYLRLSVTDGDDLENNSIGNQKKIGLDYLKDKADIQFEKVYIDNGHTGMNYRRPGYQEMLCDLQAGTINCVIVKDVSRLGRNYILTSELIEKTLPEMSVRLICVNDAFDSGDPGADHESLLMPFKLIMNDSYVKDTSRKIRSSIHTRMNCGEFLPAAGSIPSGFKRSPEQNTFAVDHESAQTVLRIFEMRAAGVAFSDIARQLNTDGIPSPGKLRYLRGITTAQRYKDALWIHGTIRKITSEQAYLGHRVHGKVKCERLGAEKRWRDPSEWMIIEHAHPSIVTQVLFDRVQQINTSELMRRSQFSKCEAPAIDYRDIFSGKVFCADCGKAMGNVKQTQRKGSSLPNHFSFQCNTYTNSSHLRCGNHYLAHEVLMEKVKHFLNREMAVAVDIERLITDIQSRPDVRRNQTQLEGSLVSVRVRRTNMEAKKKRLFADFVDGLLTRLEYEQIKHQYDGEYEILCQQENEASVQAAALEHLINNTKTWTASIRKSIELPVIDAQILDEVIDKILIGADKSVHISLKYSDPYASITAYLQEALEVVEHAG